MSRKKKLSVENPTRESNRPLVGVDDELSLYDLTDLLHGYYKYHNEDCLIEFQQVDSIDLKTGSVKEVNASLPRFEALRRIEALKLGGRPYFGGKGIVVTKPNVNNGYARLLFDYVTLPFKSIFSDGAFCKIRINKKLYDVSKLSEQEQEEQKLISKNNPNLTANAELSTDVTKCFVDVLKTSRDVKKCHDYMPLQFAQNAIVALLHSDIDRTVIPVPVLDLITEPQCEWDTNTWSNFFVIRKMSAHEVVSKIKKPGNFWNKDALRWALQNSLDSKGSLTSRHYSGGSTLEGAHVSTASENFAVKSFYQEKKKRATNLSGYYGNLLVVEGYYLNTKGTVTKVIFFPSQSCSQVPFSQRVTKDSYSKDEKKERKKLGIEKADVLYRRETTSKSLSDFITIIPANRDELSLERQRFYGHELFNPIETVMRLDSCILSTAHMISVVYTKNRNQANDSQDTEDLEIKFNGESVDIGDRDIIETPFVADLKSLVAARQIYLQHVMSKAFLGGLDGTETVSSGRGANMANLRLIRDGRVHKHSANSFASGLTEFYTKIFTSILDIINNPAVFEDDVAVKKLFYDMLVKGLGYEEKIFDFEDDEVIPDTGLPYWMSLEAVKSGASDFGAAELVLYSEIKQIFGDGLDKHALDALNRMGIKSLLGVQDALDILGDPKDQMIVEQEQTYRATIENAAILGSVDQGTINFEHVAILPDKDDPIAHLMVHNPKANEIIKRLNEADVAMESMEQDPSEQELETRTNLILKLAALANHVSLHQRQLEMFGKNREDVNKLKEETNAILQSAEGLLNNLQGNLRALQSLRQDKELRLQNLSPENEAEKLKQQKDLEELSAKKTDSQTKLLLANKIAEQKQTQHIDKQLTKARDRALKEKIAERDFSIRKLELLQAEKDNSQSENVNGTGNRP